MSERLPEFSELIPAMDGKIVVVGSCTYFHPNDMEDILHKLIPEGATLDLIRVGVKVYEIIEWSAVQRAYRVRWFRCNLTEDELMWLSGQGPRPDAA